MLLKKFRNYYHYFTKTEITLWCISVLSILIFFFIFDRNNVLTLTASLIGVTSLIFNAKGNPLGQILMVIFSSLYGVISYSFHYYGEMITYLGMTAPMAVFALISWLQNPYNGKQGGSKDQPTEIKRNHIYDTADNTCHFYLLLYPGSIPYRQHSAQYDIGDHQFPCRLSDVPKKYILCRRLCRK